MSETSSTIKPLTVYGHYVGPNPWKVRIILEELSIPYEWCPVEFRDVKGEEYVKVNPNGRLPAVEDPNTGSHCGRFVATRRHRDGFF